MRLIRALLATLCAALSLVVVTAGPSFACSCVMNGTAQHVEGAEVVVTGTVTEITPPPQRRVMSSMDPATYTVEVEDVHKGDAGETIAVLSPNSGASCGLEGIEEGRRYIVFASHRSMEGGDEDHLWANLCGGTAPATPDLVAEVEAATETPRSPDAGDTAYGSDLEITYDERPTGAGPEETEGAFLAAPVAMGAGGALVLLTGVLWLRLRRA
jgi:hypothetical protein